MQYIKKTIYLRPEDEALWKACPNKSLLVHNALHNQPAAPAISNVKISAPRVQPASTGKVSKACPHGKTFATCHEMNCVKAHRLGL